MSSAAPCATSCSAGRCSTWTSPARSPSGPRARTRTPRRRRAVPALRCPRRLARGALRGPDRRLHAAPRLDRGRPGDPRLHDQRDRAAARGRRARRSVRRARRPGGAGSSARSAPSVFEADPLRLLRAVRFEEELGFVDRAAHRAPASGSRRGSSRGRPASGSSRCCSGWASPAGSASTSSGSCAARRLARARRARRRRRFAGVPARRLPPGLARPAADLARAPALRRRAAAQLAAVRLVAARSLHRFRRSDRAVGRLDALAFHGRLDLADALAESRAADPAEPLLRGDELGLPEGPEIGALLELIAEERAAGMISYPRGGARACPTTHTLKRVQERFARTAARMVERERGAARDASRGAAPVRAVGRQRARARLGCRDGRARARPRARSSARCRARHRRGAPRATAAQAADGARQRRAS